LANEPEVKNKWLCFEIIRQIINCKREGSFEIIECNSVKKGLEKIMIDDFNFFKQTVQYFSSSSLFNSALGDLLPSFSDDQIEDLVSNCFVFNKHSFHHEQRSTMLERFLAKASDEKQKFLLSTVFEKWYLFFKGLFSLEDFYQNELLLTDYADFIVTYYSALASDEEVVVEIKNAVDKIRYFDTVWATSKSNQITKFYLFYSKLYLLSWAYKSKNLKDIEIETLLTELKQNEIVKQRYLGNGNLQSLDVIKENVLQQ
jgi:hypothetical protein